MTRLPPSFDVIIDNLPQIAAAYSDGAAARVQHEIWKRFASAFRTEAWTISERPGGVTVALSGKDAAECLRVVHVEAALVAAARRPVAIKTQQIVPSLSISFGEPNKFAPLAELDAVQYRIDMCAAALAYEALNAGELRFAEQLVVGGEDYARPFYYECLARLFDVDGAIVLPRSYIDALERLGLMRVFDWHAVRETIRQLQNRPDVVLGCNVSALSAVDDIWWTSALAELHRRPDIAKRLVIEITETAALPSMADAMAFISAIKGTEARVALDDFGIAHHSTDFACEANFDIVKIDGSYVRNRLSGNGQDLLAYLVRLVSELAPVVVVEGIESANDLRAAIATGAKFFQGYYFQTPVFPEHLPSRSLTTGWEKVR
ncbi:EAL domain-containing protein [Rhizobium sp. SG570]|uniref:EAL domain-containing protein n=1 Tax=Rhizobium sp. SG570 TaxID=2587113 RepID=UPI001446574E|nr:EAL domain-containing protein [Rhizobium sp. SG570]NKJ40327.1 EAL domain-containing protein (putative c-di-GMP-specific phosphodiesterase class I) [Rhizobium sp. SG570]